MNDAATATPVFLKKGSDYDRVKRDGTRVSTRWFNVMACASCLSDVRVGIVVGRRFGNAVKRNRGKRIFRALVRNTRERLVTGHDIVVFPKRSALDLPHPHLHRAWVSTLSHQGLMVATAPAVAPSVAPESPPCAP